MAPHASPTDERLRHTIAGGMRMSPIFRPLMLMELLGHRSPISGSVKCRVLTRARGRCECCGAELLLSKPRISGPWR